MDYFLYLFLGIFAGLSAGLLGVGGGIIVVPVLAFLFEKEHFSPEIIMHLAIGTSLAIMSFTALSSSFAYQRKKLIIWPLFLKFTPGLVLGTILGAIISKYSTSHNLRIAFAIFMIFISLKMFFSKKENTNSSSQKSFMLMLIAAIIIGILSGIFGVGGGILMVPFFVYCSVEMHHATGTSAACGFPVAVGGTIAFTIAGWATSAQYHSAVGTYGFVYWPAAILVAISSIIFAPLGTWLATILPSEILKRIFAFILLITAVNLLIV